MGVITTNTACQECPENAFFSAKCNQCLSRRDVDLGKCYEDKSDKPSQSDNGPQPCNMNCTGKGNSSYQHPDNLSRYYTCQSGILLACQRCVSNLIYSEKCDECQHPEGPFECSTTTTYKNLRKCDPKWCDDKKKNANYEFEPNSSQFYMCSEQNCHIFDCPSGLKFSKVCGKRNGVCTYNYTDSEHQCEPEIQKTEPNTPNIFCIPNEFCLNLPRRNYYLNPNNSKQRYYCKEPRVCLVERAPAGTTWNSPLTFVRDSQTN